MRRNWRAACNFTISSGRQWPYTGQGTAAHLRGLESQAIKQCLYPVCNTAFKGTLRIFAKFDVQGREHIPARGPFIVVSNHLSYLDPAVVGAVLPGKPGFLAKKELFRNPFVRFLLNGYGAFPVDRGHADVRALNWAARKLKAGGVVVVFPEGTRSKGAGLLKAHAGPVLLATMTGAPLLPVAITGSEPLSNLLVAAVPRVDMTCTIGRPFRVQAGERRSRREILERATAEMMWRISAMLPPGHRGQYKDGAPATYEVTTDLGPGDRASDD